MATEIPRMPLSAVPSAQATLLPGARMPSVDIPPKLGSLYVGDLATDVRWIMMEHVVFFFFPPPPPFFFPCAFKDV